MKKSILFSFILTTTILSARAQALECPILDTTRMPTVTITPGKGHVDNESLNLIFRSPAVKKGDSDTVQYLKVKDKDGSVNLLLLNYLAQDPATDMKALTPQVIASLERRKAYWKEEYRKAELAKDSARLTLIDTSLQMTDFVMKTLKKDPSTVATSEELKTIIRDVIGPMTDYDEVMTYDYSDYDFKKRGYEAKPAKRLKDILPKEFYETASSTSAGGVFNFKKVSSSNCQYIPVQGGIPARQGKSPDERGSLSKPVTKPLGTK